MSIAHDWLMPSPFWGENGYRNAEFFRPALFELQTDEFMQSFIDAAGASTSSSLESVRLKPNLDQTPNKLYLPIHGRFYLSAASLCCRESGFPDKQLAFKEGENVSFVLRKLVGTDEYGWIVGENGDLPSGTKGWLPLNGTGRKVLEGEERLPAFPVPTGDGRRLFCSYVPTTSGETYGVKPSVLAVQDEDPPALQEFSGRFIAPLYDHPEPDNPGSLKSMVDLIEDDDIALTTSVYLLVEFLEYLQEYLPEVANALEPDASDPVFSGDNAQGQAELLDYLETHYYKDVLTLASALQKVAEEYDELNATGGGDLAALGFTQLAYSLKDSDELDNDALDDLRDAVEDALPEESLPVELPKLEVSDAIRYVLRFVFERPQCDPIQVEVSLPSQPFTFAPFFDPEAPSRKFKIPLPSDVSIAGLRKANKNVSFMMSNAMRKKMNMILGREEDLLSDDPDVNAEDGLDFAFICSFSIQIIFIVAFMLLLIFVFVLNIVFWWLPFFKICFPIPKAVLPD